MNILEVKGVSKKYANHLALDNVSLCIKPGDIFGLLGPNGAGKTTLIRMINHITAPDTGEILFMGKKLTREMVRSIGYLPEERGLYPKMKVGEQAVYLAQLKGLSRHEALKRLKVWFEKFDIISWWDKKVNELSKGMQQKVQFICTIVHEPDLLILDEPFSGFDPINQQMLQDEIQRYSNQGKTIIFSTHQMHAAENICDKMALINKSKKILDGDIKEIIKEFGSDKYQVHYNSNTPLFQTPIEGVNLIENESVDSRSKLTFETKDNTGIKHVINTVLQEGSLIEFKELVPTVHEIFIQCVSNNNQN
ncbi:ATP-binding cassette domain-containing protein [Halosquirtibacter laminarini]|uniref:ATP-binding cassette domain-containing protein n=1 Tax=Halosquirtibacter laminarini TaxID=3374600 RepID=A0AC61NNE6_9BACT|nr:ATP-binding cassette domain-containing protein [Prolixibacteraceae bacterium]